MDTPSGLKDSIPAWIKFSVQAPGEIPYNGIYYDPPDEVCHIIFHYLYEEGSLSVVGMLVTFVVASNSFIEVIYIKSKG